MKIYILVLLTTLLTASIVTAQATPSYALTRQQTLKKEKVLRKNSKDKVIGPQGQKGTRGMALQKGGDISGSSRTIPMVTKPLVPTAQ